MTATQRRYGRSAQLRRYVTTRQYLACEKKSRGVRMGLLKHRAEGLRMKEAAAIVGVTVKQADWHWQRLQHQIGVFDFALMVQWALLNGYAEWKVKPEQMAA